jgi:hypothetical protein
MAMKKSIKKWKWGRDSKQEVIEIPKAKIRAAKKSSKNIKNEYIALL